MHSRWNILLSFAFKPRSSQTYPLYPVANGFLVHWGRNLLWWLVLLLTLASLVLLELGISSIRKAFWPTDTEIFQELQKDKIIKRRFEETVRAEEEGGEVEMGTDVKTSLEAAREGEIQELLDRPRAVMDGSADLVKSPVETEPQAQMQRSGSGHLTKRKFSTDVQNIEEFEMVPTRRAGNVPPKTRHSVDIAEVMGRRI